MRYPFEEIRAIRESVGEKMLFLKCVSADVKRLLADPEMIHNALAGQDEKTRPCIRCQERAEQLGSEGHNVTIIDMIPTESMSHTVNRASQQEIIMMRFPKYGVRMEENCKIKEFTENEVICDTPDDEKRFEMDSAVIALGVALYNPLTEKLQKLYQDIWQP